MVNKYKEMLKKCCAKHGNVKGKEIAKRVAHMRGWI